MSMSMQRRPGTRSSVLGAACRPVVENLEGRRLFASIVVTGTSDNIAVDGVVTLREALNSTNNNISFNADVAAAVSGSYGADTITFDPAVFANPQTITLAGLATAPELLPADRGPLTIYDTATTTITGPAAGVTISGGGAGAVFDVASSTTANLSKLTITGGFNATGLAGAIRNAGTLTLTDCAVTGNTGVAIRSTSGALTLTRTVVSNNTAPLGNGGGIYSSATTLSMTDCTVDNNTTSAGLADGAGIYLLGGTANLRNCTISNNTTSHSGGGIMVDFGTTVTLTQCTIAGNNSGNTAGSPEVAPVIGAGAGMYVTGSSTVSLLNCTVSDNHAGGAGGGIANIGFTRVVNSIVAANTANEGGPNFLGTLATGSSNNYIGDAPQLGELKDNGGLTNTMRPAGTSPAVDTGSNTPVSEAVGLTLEHVTPTGTTPDSVAIGSFTLTFNGQTTVPMLVVSATAADIQAKLQALSSVGAGNVTVQAGQPGFFQITFGGALAGQDLPLMTATGFDGGNATINLIRDGISFDQRGAGFARIRNSTVDIGAVEFGYTESLVVTTPADEDDGTSDATIGQGTSLREAINYALSTPGDDTITFDENAFPTGSLTQVGVTTAPFDIPGGHGKLTITGLGASRVGIRGDFEFLDVNSDADVKLTDIRIDGFFRKYGGAPISNNGTLTFERCVVINVVGGIESSAFRNNGTMNIIDSTFTNNGVYWDDNLDSGTIVNTGTLSARNSTFSGNKSNGSHGSVLLNTGGAATFVNCTITNNLSYASDPDSDPSIEGTIIVTGGTLTLNNTIVAGNFHTTGDGTGDEPAAFSKDVVGAATGSNNIIGNGDGMTGITNGGAAANQVGTAASPIDPKLGALGDNGGPTPTHLPLSGSPALNKGKDSLVPAGVTKDQRGENRFVGVVDVGSVEVQNTAPTANAGGPYSVAEGGNVVLNGGASTDDQDAAAALTYAWDLDGDGIFGETGGNASLGNETGATPTFSAAGLDGPSSVTVKLRVTDTGGLSSTDATATINVTNVAPTAAAIGGPAGLNRNQLGAFTFGASDPSAADVSAGLTYNINWGDGSTSSVNNGASQSLNHAFATVGVYTISYTVTDKDGGVSTPVTKQLTVAGAQVLTDLTDGTKTALVVGGTSGNDVIKIDKSGSSAKVTLNNVVLGTFSFTGAFYVFGQNGDDTITVASNLGNDAFLFGGEGNDSITAGNGRAVAVGNLGNDTITTGNGRDVLIGGLGADSLSGGNGEDLLIAGATAWDTYSAANVLKLRQIRDEWSRNDSYGNRINRLRGVTAGSPVTLLTSGASRNIFDDLAADRLTGGNDNDWLLANTGGGGVLDVLTDRKTTETVTDL